MSPLSFLLESSPADNLNVIPMLKELQGERVHKVITSTLQNIVCISEKIGYSLKDNQHTEPERTSASPQPPMPPEDYGFPLSPTSSKDTASERTSAPSPVTSEGIEEDDIFVPPTTPTKLRKYAEREPEELRRFQLQELIRTKGDCAVLSVIAGSAALTLAAHNSKPPPQPPRKEKTEELSPTHSSDKSPTPQESVEETSPPEVPSKEKKKKCLSSHTIAKISTVVGGLGVVFAVLFHPQFHVFPKEWIGGINTVYVAGGLGVAIGAPGAYHWWKSRKLGKIPSPEEPQS